MADNIVAPLGTGGPTIRTDDLGGTPAVHVAATKLITGADGVDGGWVTVANGLPVRLTDGSAFYNTPAAAQLPASLGQKAMAASLAVVIASDQGAVPVSGTVAATQSGAWSVSIGAALPTGANVIGGVTQSGTWTVQQGGAPWSISAASLPLPTGAATEATLGGVLTTTAFQARVATLGQKAMAGSMPVTIASDQGAVPVSGTFWQATQPVSGTVTANAGTGTFAISAASLPLPTGAAADATLTGGSQKSIVRGGAKGATAAADVTSTSIDADHNALDVSVKGTATISGTVTATQGTAAAATAPWAARLSDGAAFYNAPAAAQLPSALVGGRLSVDGSGVTQPVSIAGTVAVSSATLALDATLTGGTQKAIARGAAKGTTTAADVTSTNVDANTQALDVSVKGTVPVSGTFWQATQPVSASSLPLPTGASTETTLATMLTLAGFQARINTLGAKTSAASTPVVLASDQATLPVSAASLPLPSGASTSAAQTDGTQKSIVRGGAKGTTGAADITSTAQGSNNQAIDAQLYHGGSAINPQTIRALTSADVVTAAQGTAAALAGRWPVIVTDGTNTMPTGDAVGRAIYMRNTDGTNVAAVKAASTAPVVADPALVVATSPNSPQLSQDRATVTLGSKYGEQMVGVDNNVARLVRVGSWGELRTASATLLWHDAFEVANINAWWTQLLTTMTAVQATGVLTLNNSSITTLNTAAIVISKRQFAKVPKTPLVCRYNARITANVAGNRTLVEMGFGTPGGITAIISDGAFFRWRADGTLAVCLSYNGTEQVTQVLAQGIVNTLNYYAYEIIADDLYVRFIVSDSAGTPIVDTQLAMTASVPALWSVSHLPTFARVYVDATGGGTAIQLKIAAHSVQMLDEMTNTSWGEQLASVGRTATQHPQTQAQTPQMANAAAPGSATPSNTASAYATLGGEYAAAATLGGESVLSLFGYTVPAPYTLYVRAIHIPKPVVQGATIATVPLLQWFVAYNASSTNLSTATGVIRVPLPGMMNTAAAAAAGTLFLGDSIIWTPPTPIVCLPGTVLHIGYKSITGAATASLVYRGSVFVDGYFA